MQIIKQIGSGNNRVTELMKVKGLTTQEFNIDGKFTGTFRRPFDFEKWMNNLSVNRLLF